MSVHIVDAWTMQGLGVSAKTSELIIHTKLWLPQNSTVIPEYPHAGYLFQDHLQITKFTCTQFLYIKWHRIIHIEGLPHMWIPNYSSEIAFDPQLVESEDTKSGDSKGQLCIHWKKIWSSNPCCSRDHCILFNGHSFISNLPPGVSFLLFKVSLAMSIGSVKPENIFSAFILKW